MISLDMTLGSNISLFTNLGMEMTVLCAGGGVPSENENTKFGVRERGANDAMF